MLLRIAIITVALLFSAATYASAGGDVNEFWSRFREAVLEGDTEKVASMTKLPLWVRGPLDSDPVVHCDKKRFPSVLKRLVNQEVLSFTGSKVTRKTMRQVIQEKQKIVAQDHLTPDLFTIEMFHFQRIRGKWLLSKAYLEE